MEPVLTSLYDNGSVDHLFLLQVDVVFPLFFLLYLMKILKMKYHQCFNNGGRDIYYKFIDDCNDFNIAKIATKQVSQLNKLVFKNV